jgi:hypothetical protein
MAALGMQAAAGVPAFAHKAILPDSEEERDPITVGASGGGQGMEIPGATAGGVQIPSAGAPPTATAPTETAIDPDNPLASAAGYEAERVDLEDNDTVEGRVANIIKDDSPLMQIARTRANQESNSKGTLNSSMAVGAGQMAVMDAATPIATEDARGSREFKLSNQMESNKADQFNTEQINQGRAEVYKGELEKYMQSEQGRIDLGKIAANIEGDSRLLNEKGEIDLGLQADQFARQTDLQDRKGEIDKMLVNADGDVKSQLQAEMAEIDKEINAINDTYAQRLQDQKGEIDLMLQDANAEDQEALEKIKGEIDKQIQSLRNTGAARVANINAQSALDQIKNKGFVDFALQNSAFKDDKEMQDLVHSQGIIMAEVNKDNEVLIAGNLAAANASGQHGLNVTNIALNPDMTTTQKRDAIANETEVYKATLAVIDLAAGTDFDDLIVAREEEADDNTTQAEVDYLNSRLPEGSPQYTVNDDGDAVGPDGQLYNLGVGPSYGDYQGSPIM